MSTAVCKECNLIIHWRAQRGCKLSDHKCHECGGGLEAWNNKKHEGQTPLSYTNSLGKTFNYTGYRIGDHAKRITE